MNEPSERALELAQEVLETSNRGLEATEVAHQEDPHDPELLVLCAGFAGNAASVYRGVPQFRAQAWKTYVRAHDLADHICIDDLTDRPRRPPEDLSAAAATLIAECLESAITRGNVRAFHDAKVDAVLATLESLESDASEPRSASIREQLQASQASGCALAFLVAASVAASSWMVWL